MRSPLLRQLQLMFRTDRSGRPHAREHALDRDNSNEIRIIAFFVVFPLVATLAWHAASVPARPVLFGAVVAIVVANGLGWALPWSRMPRWTEGSMPLATVAASWLLVASVGGYGSGFIVLLLPPLLWLAMYADLAEVVAGLGIVYATALVPIDQLLDSLPPQGSTEARLAGAVVATLAVLGIRPLVAELRMQVDASGRATRSLRASQAALAHDLRTPLTSVCALASLLEQRLQGMDGDDADVQVLREYARRIGDLGWRAERTIRGVLDLASAGEALPHATWFDPRRMLDELASELDSVTLVRGELPDRVYGHEPSIRRAFANLLENAARHGRGEADATAVGVAVACEELATGWRFTLVDDGPGIDPAEADSLFQPWRRGSGASDGGHGLGLAIVAAIVEQHGGSITAANAPGGGATFTFTLDRAPRLARAEAAVGASGDART